MIKLLLTLSASCAVFFTSCGVGASWTVTPDGLSTVKDGVVITIGRDGKVHLAPAESPDSSPAPVTVNPSGK